MTDDQGASGATNPNVPATNLSRLNTVLIGLGAGVLNGLLGIGGGIFIVPGMIFLLGASPRQAVSTSLGTMLILSVIAFTAHISISGVYFGWLGTAILLLCCIVGSQIGSWLLRRLNQRWILIMFSFLTVISAANLAYKGFSVDPTTLVPQVPPLWSYGVIGIIAGFFSGLLGVGGGGLTVMGFALIYHTPILEGIPLALAVNIINALSGVVAQWKSRLILWKQILRMVPAALVGIALGTVAAVYLPANQLRIIFAVFFIYMGIRLFRKGWKG